jgi:hypothetical protein
VIENNRREDMGGNFLEGEKEITVADEAIKSGSYMA